MDIANKSIARLNKIVGEYIDESMTIPFYYGIDFVVKANNIAKDLGFNPEEIVGPFTIGKELKAPFKKNETHAVNLYYFQFKNDEKYVFEFSAPLKRTQTHPDGGSLSKTSPSENGVNDKYSILYSPNNDLETSLLRHFTKWLNNIITWENKLKEFTKSGMHSSQANIEALQIMNDKDGKLLYTEIQTAINRNEHQAALDRLHTWMVRYVRNIANINNIPWNDGETLVAIFNKISKYYRDMNYIESAMSGSILKGIGKNLDDFNSVRNNQSFAHANSLLNQAEARFICNTTFDAVNFINGIQAKFDKAVRVSELKD